MIKGFCWPLLLESCQNLLYEIPLTSTILALPFIVTFGIIVGVVGIIGIGGFILLPIYCAPAALAAPIIAVCGRP